MDLHKREMLYNMIGGGMPIQSYEKKDSFKIKYKSSKVINITQDDLDDQIADMDFYIPGTEETISKLKGKVLTINIAFIGPKNDKQETDLIISSMKDDVKVNFPEITLNRTKFMLSM